MDITLIKTFLEVANSGSFVAASDRLYGKPTPRAVLPQ